MIILKEISKKTQDEVVAALYADTKAEVPNTGTLTKAAIADSFTGKLGCSSTIFTADLDIGILKSDDTWQWS